MSHLKTIYVNGQPYMNVDEEDGYCSPIVVVSHVGQKVKIDWTEDLKYKPKHVPPIREFQVTEIEHEQHFKGFSTNDPDKTITEIFFDARGGWTERMIDPEQKRPLCYSHPILTFL
jgi:hypothetical protein